jgi:HlyD family secretion protein
MLDARTWHVETEDLSELDVVHVAAGDAVEVTVDALPDVMLAGTVRQVQALGTNRQGDIVYTVVVDLNESDPRLRWNMTATIMK